MESKKNWWEGADVPQMDWPLDQVADAALWGEETQYELSRRSKRTHFIVGRAYEVIAAKLAAEGRPHSLRAIRAVLEERLRNSPDPQKRLPPSIETIRRDKFTAEQFADDPSELDQFETHVDALKEKGFFWRDEFGRNLLDHQGDDDDADDQGDDPDNDDSQDDEADDDGHEEEEDDQGKDDKPEPKKLPFPNDKEQEEILADLKKRKDEEAKRKDEKAKSKAHKHKSEDPELPVTESILLDMLRGNAEALANHRQLIRDAVAERPEFAVDIRHSVLTIQEQIEMLLGVLPSA
jgi:hypothetical protein